MYSNNPEMNKMAKDNMLLATNELSKALQAT